ncbi:uncharacterized protein LOC125825077 [Solanum verrucosum]|uniref:uncharacterized protein LOC125825077 n=1 Tax=Solanum verrucosum TaxID=315347 RepID=UPI0020D0C4E9|nr:uncharacterized protein LOC125825077 [Solanum verrucosum]
MSGYAKFMKGIVSKKRSMYSKTIEVSHNCSAIMTSEMITKKEDFGAFTIPCTIDMLQFTKALCDLGGKYKSNALCNLKQLGMGEQKSTTMRFFMANRLIKHPIGILYDKLVMVDRFIFLVDFVILDCEIDAEVPTLLGRPFFPIGIDLVDVKSEELMFCVNEDEVTFNMCKSMKHPSDIYVVLMTDVIDEAMDSVSHLMCMSEPVEATFVNYDENKVQD